MRLQNFLVKPREGYRLSRNLRWFSGNSQQPFVIGLLEKISQPFVRCSRRGRVEVEEIRSFYFEVIAAAHDECPFNQRCFWNLNGGQSELGRVLFHWPVFNFLSRHKPERELFARWKRFGQRNAVAVPAGFARTDLPRQRTAIDFDQLDTPFGRQSEGDIEERCKMTFDLRRG